MSSTPTSSVLLDRTDATDPRETMRVLPRFLQYPLTVFTGKPLVGQRHFRWWTPGYHLFQAFLAPVLGVALGAVAWRLSGLWLLMLLPSWAITLHGMRNLRMLIFHQCSHRNMFRRRRLDTAIGGAIASLLIVQHFERYSREHVSDHHAVHHMTLRDPTVQAFLITLDVHPGMSRARMYRRVLGKVCSPLFHAEFAWGRARSFWHGSMRAEKITALTLYGGTLAATVATGTWPAFLVIWCVPLFPLFQVSNVLRLCCKHTFPAPDAGVRRGKAYFGSLTNAVFLGEAAPTADLRGPARAKAWAGWVLRMTFVHAPIRFCVITADTPTHDYHHRYPSKKEWANYLFTRQHDLENGSPGWPSYRSCWGLGNAIDAVFDSLSAADPEEFDVRRIREVSKRELFAAFDD